VSGLIIGEDIMSNFKKFEGWYFDSPNPFGHLSKSELPKKIDWSMSHVSHWDRFKVTENNESEQLNDSTIPGNNF
jgi:hypothetical protein